MVLLCDNPEYISLELEGHVGESEAGHASLSCMLDS